MRINRETSGDFLVTDEFPFDFFDIQSIVQRISLENGKNVSEWAILTDMNDAGTVFELWFLDPSGVDDSYLDHEVLT